VSARLWISLTSHQRLMYAVMVKEEQQSQRGTHHFAQRGKNFPLNSGTSLETLLQQLQASRGMFRRDSISEGQRRRGRAPHLSKGEVGHRDVLELDGVTRGPRRRSHALGLLGDARRDDPCRLAFRRANRVEQRSAIGVLRMKNQSTSDRRE